MRLLRKTTLIISCLLVLTLFASVVFAADSVIESGTCGENLTWTLDDQGVLTISGTGRTDDYTLGTSPWYNNTKVKLVVIEEGVTYIGTNAFYSMEFIGITVPTSVVEVADSAFSVCTKLEHVVYLGTQEQWDAISIADGNPYFESRSMRHVEGTYHTLSASSLCTVNTINCDVCNKKLKIENKEASHNFIDGRCSICGVEDIWGYSVNPYSGTVKIESCNGGSFLVIPSEIEGFPVSEIERTMPASRKMVCVFIPTSVTRIWTYGFEHCDNLQHILYEGTESQWQQISISGTNYMFEHATRHYNANSQAVRQTDHCTISEWYCNECQKEIAYMQREDATHTFENGVCSVCGIEDGWQYSVFGGEIYITGYTGNAEEVAVPKTIETCPVTTLQNEVFRDHVELKKVIIPASVQSMQGVAFTGCSNLKNIIIESGSQRYMNDEHGVVYGLYNGNITNVVAAPKALSGHYTIKNGVNTVDSSAFKGCVQMTGITIPDSVNEIQLEAFSGCTGLTTIKLPSSINKIDWAVFDGCTGLKSLTIPSGVTQIAYRAFANCTSLETISIPKSVVSIYNNAFQNTAKLDGIWLEAGNPNYSNDSKGVLLNKDKSKILAAPGGLKGTYQIPASVTNIGSEAFSWMSELTDVEIHKGVTTIEKTAFASCSSKFKGVRVDPENPNFSNDDRGVLFNKTKTQLIAAPGGLAGSYSIPESVTSIAENAFENCDVLTGVTIPNTVERLGSSAFVWCDGLKSVVIPGSIYTIPEYAFTRCEGLERVILSQGVSSIGFRAFSNCYHLKQIVMPTTISSVSEQAFLYCDGINEVYYTGTQDDWQWMVINEGNDGLTSATIRYGQTLTVEADLNGDYELNDADAMYLLRATLFPERYPVDQSVDMNGDGEVNDADAMYLLRHTLFPERYPLLQNEK